MRLIDADALEYLPLIVSCGNGKYNTVKVLYERDIEDAPTIDAEPVTRCADCENSLEHNGQLFCILETWLGYPREPEDFCSRAIPARKEENE